MLDIEKEPQSPLVIRGHHLANLHEFYYWHYWGYQRNLPEFVNELVGVVVNFYEDPTYVTDVLGNTPKETNRFKDQVKSVIKRFVELPDEHPLELVEGIPDEICAGCAIGKHCRTRFYDANREDLAFQDRQWIDWLLEYSHYYSEKVDISIRKELVSFLNSPSQELRRVSTTLGAIRNALPYFY